MNLETIRQRGRKTCPTLVSPSPLSPFLSVALPVSSLSLPLLRAPSLPFALSLSHRRPPPLERSLSLSLQDSMQLSWGRIPRGKAAPSLASSSPLSRSPSITSSSFKDVHSLLNEGPTSIPKAPLRRPFARRTPCKPSSQRQPWSSTASDRRAPPFARGLRFVRGLRSACASPSLAASDRPFTRGLRSACTSARRPSFAHGLRSPFARGFRSACASARRLRFARGLRSARAFPSLAASDVRLPFAASLRSACAIPGRRSETSPPSAPPPPPLLLGAPSRRHRSALYRSLKKKYPRRTCPMWDNPSPAGDGENLGL